MSDTSPLLGDTGGERRTGVGPVTEPRQTALLREIGRVWAAAQRPASSLLDMVDVLTDTVIDVTGSVPAQGSAEARARIREMGDHILGALLIGFAHAGKATDTAGAGPGPVAVALLEGLDVPPDERERLADAYALVAVYGPEYLRKTCLQDELGRIAGPCALTAVNGPFGYLLVPARTAEDALHHARDLHTRMPGPSWTAVTWCQRAGIPAGRLEVRNVEAIAVASGRPPGVYRVADFTVEYAVLQQPDVVGRLIEIITPVIRQRTLRGSLESLIAADGNRSRAAADLKVHRSTLDYRLRRIGDLTGKDPTNARNLQVLSIALTVHATVHGAILGSHLAAPA